jgi:hypothetical protein
MCIPLSTVLSTTWYIQDFGLVRLMEWSHLMAPDLRILHDSTYTFIYCEGHSKLEYPHGSRISILTSVK